MDYSIGSLSDLITGKRTPNKTKVIMKKVNLESNYSTTKSRSENEETNASHSVLLKKKNVSKIVKKLTSTEKTDATVRKKRKLSNDNENEPQPKKSKSFENAQRRIQSKEKKERPPMDPEEMTRSIFVGNLPITCEVEEVKKLFSKYGQVETARIRGVPVAHPKTRKRVAFIKKEFHPERKSLYAFVRFVTREDAVKATVVNGEVFKDHHLRVTLCVDENKIDESKAIFLGNLSFYAEEEDIWKLFQSCGPIASVRVVRNKLGVGKGFGYVNFKNSDSVTLALEMQNVTLKDREIRISVCNSSAAKKIKKTGKFKKIKKAGKPKKLQKETKSEEDDNSDEQSTIKIQQKSFQGVVFSDKKKKNKLNRGLIQKKRIIKKIAPKQ